VNSARRLGEAWIVATVVQLVVDRSLDIHAELKIVGMYLTSVLILDFLYETFKR